MLTALRGRILKCWPAVLGDLMAIDLITGTLLILSDLCSKRPLLLPLLFRMGGVDGLPTKKQGQKKCAQKLPLLLTHTSSAFPRIWSCVCVCAKMGTRGLHLQHNSLKGMDLSEHHISPPSPCFGGDGIRSHPRIRYLGWRKQTAQSSSAAVSASAIQSGKLSKQTCLLHPFSSLLHLGSKSHTLAISTVRPPQV